MIYRVFLQKTVKVLIPLSLYALFFLPLLFTFAWPNARDADVYRRAFEDVLNGIDPYESSTFRAGLFGSMIIYLISIPFKGLLASLFFLILNAIGYWFFISRLTKKIDLQIPLYFLIAWSSASREGLNTIQITGILMGISALILIILETKPINFKWVILNSLLAAAAIDLKPHLIFLTFVLLCLKFKSKYFFVSTFAILSLSHLCIDLYFGHFYEMEWLRLLLDLNGRASTELSNDSVNLYAFNRYLSSVGVDINISVNLLMLVVTLLFLIRNISKIESVVIVGIGSTLAFFGPYFHYYDTLPIICVALFILITKRMSITSGFYLASIIVTLNPNSINALIILGLGNLMFLLGNHRNYTYVNIFGIVKHFSGAAIQFIILTDLKNILKLNEHIYPLMVSVIYVMSLITIAREYSREKKIHLVS